MRRGNDGSAPPLGLKELPPAPTGFHATALARELNAGLARVKQRGKQPSLLFLLARLNARRFLWSGILRVLNSVVQFLPALCLGSLLAAIEHGHHVAGLKAAAALFAVLCTKTFVESHYFFHTANIAVRVRATLQAAIYEKSLRLPEAAAAVPPVTLMQVDTGKAEELAFSAHTLWNGIFQVIGYSALLVHYVGMAGVGGLFVLVACLPLNAWLQRKLSGLNRKVLQANEARVTRTGEILSGIRAIRQMGWEDVFEQTVLESRDQELEAQRRRDRVSAYLVSVFGALPPFMIAVVLTLYVLGPGGAFRPSVVFTALSLLEQIRFPLIFYPVALNALAEGRAALGRILTFLSLEEAPAPRPAPRRPAGAGGTSLASAAEAASVAVLEVPAGRYPLSGGKGPELVLSEPVVVREGELVAIVGRVGAGKTTLAKALLGELPQSGLPAPHGRVAYCAQQPWIPSGTLRDVIAGGAEFEAGALEEACSAALIDFARPDDEINPGTLSGGQQARVALARAVYHQRARGDDGRPVVASVLDDVTAALDPQVATTVTERCIFGALDGSTRLVVTSDTGPLLRRCDRVLVMEAAPGELRLKAAGSYGDLVRQGLLEAKAFAHKPVAGAVDNVGADGAESDSEDTPSGAEAGTLTPDAAAVRVTVAEERAKGAVPLSLYRRYFGCAKSPRLLALAAASALSAYIASAGQQWFIGLWTSDQTLRRGLAFYVGGVVFFGLLASALTLGRTMLSCAFARRSSREVHRELSKKVLVHAATRHFDANPSGRILQRFSKDLEQVDTKLPDNLRSATFCVFTLSGTMGTIALASPSFLLLLGPLAWVYARALQWYRPVARELFRLEPLARSPVYTQQAATAVGVATIRQLGLGPSRAARALASVDGGTSATFAARAVDRWFSLRMELLGNGIVLAAALLGLAASAPGSAAAAGPWRAARAAIAVTQALSVVGLLCWTVRTVAQTETSFTSFQRVVYSVDHTEAEAARELPGDSALGDSWPSQGRVSFKDVTLRYRSDSAPVLQGVNLEVAPGERVGIVGRTGSGKSTLLRVLLRTFELEEGEGAVLVDGLDVRKVGLARLRSAVTVIPQENFLVTGSVRVNVDPRHEHSDEDVQGALRAASLGHWPLDRHIAASGGGISPGERQLLGIARAVLRGSRVVALDEVTSRVDAATDRKVQAALRRFPAGTTMLVVSHRLSTITDYDKVVVMKAGRVVEVGCPQELQRKPGSRFSRLLAAELSGSGASLAANEGAEAALEPVLA